MSIQQRRYRIDDLAITKDPTAEVPADKTIRFSVDGKEYEIDLSEKHAAGFWKAIRPYTEAGRPIRRGPGRRTRTTVSRVNSAKVRDWAREQGYDVKPLGRVPADIVAKYEDATGTAA
jgi:hypothetical protein